MSHYLLIGIETKNCGSMFDIQAGKEYIVKGTGDFTGQTCSYSFKAQVKKNCLGLCYDMQKGSFIQNNKTTISLESENKEQVKLCVFVHIGVVSHHQFILHLVRFIVSTFISIKNMNSS